VRLNFKNHRDAAYPKIQNQTENPVPENGSCAARSADTRPCALPAHIPPFWNPI